MVSVLRIALHRSGTLSLSFVHSPRILVSSLLQTLVLQSAIGCATASAEAIMAALDTPLLPHQPVSLPEARRIRRPPAPAQLRRRRLTYPVSVYLRPGESTLPGTRIARRAGRVHASIATNVSNRATAANVPGSADRTSYRRLESLATPGSRLRNSCGATPTIVASTLFRRTVLPTTSASPPNAVCQ
jgi:hypothetical protein